MMRLSSLFGLSRPSSACKASRRAAAPGAGHYRPTLEAFEDRVVMSATIGAPHLAAALVSTAAPAAAHQASALVPIVINSVTNNAGNLVANATVLGHNVPIPLNLTVPAGQSATATTQILNLHVAPIDLNLLGLEVKTSEICLNISATSGNGNLLGNLLTDIAHLLDNGTSLSQILGGLSTTDLGTLTTDLTMLLNGALGSLTSPQNLTAPGNSVAVTPGAATSILHLSLGPVNLSLLGLNVNLDNCAGGPITVDIIAHTGPGNLLGNLLGGLSHLLDSSANTNAIVNKLEKIADAILALV
jgi:hypothetical protein